MTDNNREFRNALGRYATGVTVVTATARDGSPIGLTCNSFASVSLSPPLVLWSLARTSLRFDDYAAASYYTIHVLGADQNALAEHFATPAADKFSGIGWEDRPDQPPLLTHCAAVFECTMRHQYDGGDHVIHVGEVLDFQQSPNGAPLVFSDGRFAALAQTPDAADAAPAPAPALHDPSDANFVDNYLGYLVGRAGFVINRGFNRLLRERDVQPAVWRVLATLSDSTMSVSELADVVLLKQPTLTKIIDKMESDALVSRKPDRNDRRKVRLVITGKGLSVVKELLILASEHESDVLAHYPAAEQKELKQMLRELIERNSPVA